MFGIDKEEVEEQRDKAIEVARDYTDRKHDVLKNFVKDKFGELVDMNSKTVSNLLKLKDEKIPQIKDNRKDIDSIKSKLRNIEARLETVENVSERNEDNVVQNTMDIENIETSLEEYVTQQELDEDVKEHFAEVVSNYKEEMVKLIYKIIEIRETDYASHLSKARLIEELDKLGFSVEEISIFLDVSENTVRSYFES